MKWTIGECQISDFIKALKAMNRIGGTVHLETYNDTSLRFQVVNNSRSVHFDLIFTDMFFLECEQTIEESNITQSRIMSMEEVDGPVRAKKCKLPLKYILRCCNPSIAKVRIVE